VLVVSCPVGRSATRIDRNQQDVGEKRSERNEDRAGGGASGHEIKIARAQAVVHQAAQAWPCCDNLYDKRPAEEAAYHGAIQPKHWPERHRPRVAMHAVSGSASASAGSGI
jgi:hypothetical protein